ncbi:PAS domain-containing protein [Haloarchaeobius sp. DYHT-AS-18]|uniref:PAS domain-containing protein n=1 Tax=Haloarchaeobius sp. DYHT-AS-18 TaxID=3446117 RepID=UPI003EBA8D2C
MSDSDAPSHPRAVALVLADSGNENVLTTWLDEHGIDAEAIEPGDPLPEDTSLCLVDIGALSRAAAEIRRQKEQRDEADEFFPCLLVVPHRLGPRVAASDDTRFDFIDELITVPIDPKTLRHRIDSLLEQHQPGKKATRTLSLDTVVEALPFATFVVVDGVVTVSNTALSRALGTDPEDLHGRRLDELVATEDRERVERLFERVELSVEHVRLVEGTESLPVELRPITIENRTVSGYLGLSRDRDEARG